MGLESFAFERAPSTAVSQHVALAVARFELVTIFAKQVFNVLRKGFGTYTFEYDKVGILGGGHPPGGSSLGARRGPYPARLQRE